MTNGCVNYLQGRKIHVMFQNMQMIKILLSYCHCMYFLQHAVMFVPKTIFYRIFLKSPGYHKGSRSEPQRQSLAGDPCPPG